MPRPTVTAEREAVWTTKWDTFKQNPPEGVPVFLLDMPMFKEVFCAGAWLEEELVAAGCPEDMVGDICFANGQRSAFRPDPWSIAEQSLERYRSGVVDQPGNELGAQLAEEVFGVACTPEQFDKDNEHFNRAKAQMNTGD
jgi:hypothetical protein